MNHPDQGAALLPLIGLAILAAAYLAATWRQHQIGRSWSAWRTVSWIGGVGLLILALTPPLTNNAHHDMGAHMLQHLLIGMFAPLGLALAAPVTLLLRTLPVPVARRTARLLRARPLAWLSHPVVALLLNTGGMYLFYLTPLYALSMSSPALHGAVLIHFLAAGYLFTWAIAGPDPGPHRPPWRDRLIVLFLAMAAHATLAKLMYAYGWPQGAMDTEAALRDAAQLMYYGGDLAELLLAIALFSATGWRAYSLRPGERSPRPVSREWRGFWP